MFFVEKEGVNLATLPLGRSALAPEHLWSARRTLLKTRYRSYKRPQRGRAARARMWRWQKVGIYLLSPEGSDPFGKDSVSFLRLLSPEGSDPFGNFFSFFLRKVFGVSDFLFSNEHFLSAKQQVRVPFRIFLPMSVSVVSLFPPAFSCKVPHHVPHIPFRTLWCYRS